MNPLAGLILCGGQSSRMGEDKCFLQYHERPQWQHLAMMLNTLCSTVIVSCSLGQVSRITQGLTSFLHPPQVLADLPDFAGHGPMSGLLSAFQVNPGPSFLLVGCDYPLLTPDDLHLLISARRENLDAVCFSAGQEGLDEPLVAIYESTSSAQVWQAFDRGEFSLQKVLKRTRTLRLTPGITQHLQSVDTPDAFHVARGRMTPSG